MVSFFGLGKKKKEAVPEGPVHSLYAQQWKREQSPFGSPRTPQTNNSSTSLSSRPSSSHSSRGPNVQNPINANKPAPGGVQALPTARNKRYGPGKPPRTGSPLRSSSSDSEPQPNLGNARPMSPGSLAAAASQAGFRFENPPQSPSHGSHTHDTGNTPKTGAPGSPAPRPSPSSIERNRSPLGRYEVRSEASSEVSSPTSQTTTRSNVTSLTSIASEMDSQIGQWAVTVSASSGIDEKLRSSPEPGRDVHGTGQMDRDAGLDESEFNGLRVLDSSMSLSEPRQSLMPHAAARDTGAGDGRGYSMILQYYLDSDARESMVI